MRQRKGWIRRCGLWIAATSAAVVVPILVAELTLDHARTARERERVAAAPRAIADPAEAFKRIGFNVRELQRTPTSVPRVLLAALPRELPDVTNAGQRKALFLTSMLPLVLQVNEIIRAERERLLALKAKEGAGFKLNTEEKKWLKTLQLKYRTKRRDFPKLLRRVNVIPPSLALAQAAIESGWGTSRFAQQGNAIFGQWTWGDDGMIPLERPDGSNHRVKTFDHLIESVASYARNLNTHSAYRPLREIREGLARDGKVITGPSLIPGLDQYSERREAYIHDLMAVIRGNRLTRFDSASLEYSALGSGPDEVEPDVLAAR